MIKTVRQPRSGQEVVQRASGQSVRSHCREMGISESTYYYRLKHASPGRKKAPAYIATPLQPTSLMEISFDSLRPSVGYGVRFHRGVMELVIPSGFKLSEVAQLIELTQSSGTPAC